MSQNKDKCVHRKQEGGILSWCGLKHDYCELKNSYGKDSWCVEFETKRFI